MPTADAASSRSCSSSSTDGIDVPAPRRPPRVSLGDSTPREHSRRPRMPRIVRGALLQATWTGDKESMIQKHEQAAHEAAGKGAQVMLFQELFYGPYFCQVQEPEYYGYTELIPDGPTTKRMKALAKQPGMAPAGPLTEEAAPRAGLYYNTAAVIDA